MIGSDSKDGCCGTPEEVLEEITFCRGEKNKADWERWFAFHFFEGRQAWLTQAMKEFDQVLARDLSEAEEILSKATFRWRDPALLPYVKQWLRFEELHSDIVGLLDDAPAWRNEYQPIADEIIARSYDSLEYWCMSSLTYYGFLPRNEPTWEEYVDQSNSSL